MGSITMALAGLDCSENCAGGISKIYVANAGDIDSVVKDVDGAVTSIVMVATKVFYAAVFKPKSKLFTENTTYNPDSCGTVVTQTLEGSIACCTQDGRIWLQEAIAQSCCGIVIIHTELAGCTMIWGLGEDLGAYVLTSDKTTGKKIEDANERVVKFECKTTPANMATEFLGTVPV